MKKELRILSWTVFWILSLLVVSEAVLSLGLPWKMPALKPYLLRHIHDNWTANAFEIEKIKTLAREKPSLNQVVFLGGSVGLSVITGDDEMNDLLKERGMKDFRFVSLCSSYKSFSDELKIVEALGAFHGVVAINMELLRFKTIGDKQLVRVIENTGYENLKYYYLPTGKKALDILQSEGVEVGLKHRFLTVRTAFPLGEMLQRQIRNISPRYGLNRTKLERHLPDPGPVSQERAAELGSNLKRLTESIHNTLPLNKRLLVAVIETALSNGNRVVLVDTPTNPLFSGQLKESEAEYDHLVQEMVGQFGLAHIDMRAPSVWGPEDFRDAHHMREQGRKKFVELFAARLSGMGW